MGLCCTALIFFSAEITGYPIKPEIYFLFGLTTFFIYQLYWLIVDINGVGVSLNSFLQNKQTLFTLLVLVFCLYLFFCFRLINPVFLLLFILILIYFLLSKKRFFISNNLVQGLSKTILLAVIWTIVTGVLPFCLLNNFAQFNIVYVLHRFTLMLLLSFIFDIRDMETDQLIQRNTMATVLRDKQRNRMLFVLTCSLFVLTTMVFHVKHELVDYAETLFALFPVLYCLMPLSRKRLGRYYYWAMDGLMIYLPLVFYIRLL